MENENLKNDEKNKRIRITDNEIIQEEVTENKESNEQKKDSNTSKKKKKEYGLHDEIKNRKNKKKWDKKKKIKVVLAVVAAIILILGVVFGTYIYKADGDIADAALTMAADVLGEKDPIFVLVLGVSEDLSSSLTDTIILAGYNPDSQKAFMVSVPRDTFVGKNEATAGGYDKINALYQKGPKKTVEAVEKLTGIKIDNYVIVKNTVLPAIVNAIGEVEFNVPIDMDYDDPTQDLHIHLKAGTQMINGDEAEQLLRFRHNNDGSSYPLEYGDNDYGRMRTQREFMKVVASQLISGENVSKLKDISSAVFDNLETDMSAAKMLGYVPYAAKFNVDNIRMEQLPGFSAKLNELWFYKHDSIETYDLINELLKELELDEKEMKEFYTPTKRVKNTTTTTVKKDNTVATNETEHVHSYQENVTRVPTCTSEGLKTLICSCGVSYTEKIDMTKHSYGEPTEKVSGNKKTITKKCTECGYTDVKTETIKEVTNTTNTTNTSSSTNTTNTSKDENTTTQNNTTNNGGTVSKPEHVHSYTENITTPATCTATGTKTLTCSSCGDSKTENISATGHKYTESITTPATCTTTGTKTLTCSSCGDSKTENISATGHTIDQATGACTVCGQAG